MKNRSPVHLTQGHPQRLQVKFEIVKTLIDCLVKGRLQDYTQIGSDNDLQQTFVFLLKDHLAEELIVCGVALLAEFCVGSSSF